MVLPIQVFIQQETKKLDIFSLINLFLANFNLDSFIQRILRGMENNKVCFLNT